MSDTAVIYMANGKTYTVNSSPSSLHESLSQNNQSGDLLKKVHLVNGKEVLVNPAHIIAVETSEMSNMDVSTSDKPDPVADENRKDANLKAAKEFKKDLDGNME
ncbi:hypothetical protein [Alkalibacterium olivapovliticus]|uniref:Uncharacterized protein n=1 Tax=Alkalibacterium olivapovliticus TaxID=99907 RepID=A0A2T0W983_9LACT|nr:hypothetical protein [Alkalibacterium olivapovliticus]PRY83270.1 hypothetical protein CLV38_10550 [Alkalibacterium olivapovliticus]